MPQPAPQPLNPQTTGDLTGKTVGRFVVQSRLGAGGMGEVYRAEDPRLKRPVALKRMAPRLQSDPTFRQRFLREAQLASGLPQQHIAGVYDVLETRDEIFVVMEFVEGVTLRRRLAEPISHVDFLAIAVQCVEALVAAHARGIVHRDVKPENIMLTPAGQVKVLDFGVAKQLPRTDDAVTLDTRGMLDEASASFGGTLAYMAPEALLEKETDHRADLFSLGVVFFEALTGRHPFRAESFLATTTRILHEEPAPLRQFNPRVPAELERIVAKMLAKSPAERYVSAADLLVDLRAAQHVMTRPPAIPDRIPPAPRRKRWALASALGALLVVLGIAAIAFLPQLRQRFYWFDHAVGAAPKNLAVLPFQAIGGAAENQAFCDGITETLTAKMTQLTMGRALQVVPSRELRTRRISSAQEARKELGVSLVLEGSIHRSGSVVRVNYALVDTGMLRQLRADTITADASDPFAVQDRVADGLVRMLELELKPQERQALQTHGTQVAGANDFYLQGRGYLQNYDKPENINNAISVFNQALSLDSNYAVAYAGLGEAYWRKYEAGKETSWLASARQACERALSLDAKLAPAHVCLGTLDNGTGEYPRAAAEFQRALETEPTSDDAYRGLGLAYERLNSLDQAERTFRQAIALRPHYWAGYSWLGAFYYRHARYGEAQEMFRQVVALAPDSLLGYSSLGAIYVQEGRYAEAIAVLAREVAIRPTARAYSNLATAYFYQRRFVDAARTYEEALKLDGRNYGLWGNLGDAYFWIPGKRANAASAYQQAIALAKEKLLVNQKDAYLLGNLALYFAMRGERTPALANLEKALRLSPGDPEVRFKSALVHNQFDETNQTLGWLEKALAAGYSSTRVRDTPNFNALQSHPRFQELLRGKR